MAILEWSLQSSLLPRAEPPTERSRWDDEQSYRVWAEYRSYLEDPKPWKLLAAFLFLQEALDYVAYAQDRGSDVIFQSPADCKLVRATDRRIVAK